MFKEEIIDINEISEILKERDITFSDNEIFIMPEFLKNDKDILNEYTPDIHKILKLNGIDNIVVKSEKYEYLALRDATVILPYIVGISISIVANFIYDWMKNNFDNQTTIKLKVMHKKKDGTYAKIEIEGNKDEIKKILDSIND